MIDIMLIRTVLCVWGLQYAYYKKYLKNQI